MSRNDPVAGQYFLVISITYRVLGRAGGTSGGTWIVNLRPDVAQRDESKFSHLIEMRCLGALSQFLAEPPEGLKRQQGYVRCPATCEPRSRQLAAKFRLIFLFASPCPRRDWQESRGCQ
jgi:hypothetical protein